jgi:signal transduction histidine kinase
LRGKGRPCTSPVAAPNRSKGSPPKSAATAAPLAEMALEDYERPIRIATRSAFITARAAARRLPAPVEAAAYYIASEALTNVAKHAQANVVELIAAHDNGVLTLEVRDDGMGGVDTARGSGILGLTDRIEALGGTISIASPPRGGTTLSVDLPMAT